MALIRYQLVLVACCRRTRPSSGAPITVSATATFTPLPSVALMGAVVLGLVRTLTPLHAVTFGTDRPKTSVGATTRCHGRRQDRTEEREREQRDEGSDRGRTARRAATANGQPRVSAPRVADAVNPATSPLRASRTRAFRTTGSLLPAVVSTRAGWPGPLHGGQEVGASSRARRSRSPRPRRGPRPGAAAAPSDRTSCSRGTRRCGSPRLRGSARRRWRAARCGRGPCRSNRPSRPPARGQPTGRRARGDRDIRAAAARGAAPGTAGHREIAGPQSAPADG